jgi:hypothetical protein
MEVLLRDIELAKQDTSESGKRKLAALEKHKQMLETVEIKPMYGRWKKVDGTDIIQVLENKTVDITYQKQHSK